MLFDMEMHVGRVQHPAAAAAAAVGGDAGGGGGRVVLSPFRKSLQGHGGGGGGAGVVVDGARARDAGEGEVFQLQANVRHLQQVERLRVLTAVALLDADGDADGD